MDLLHKNIRPLDILTRQAFENAIACVAATGGSTNAVLHLLAMAREAEISLGIDDFDAVSRRTPLIADLKPGGKYVATDVDKAGGIQLIAQRLVDGGLIDGGQLTASGETLAVEAAKAVETPGQDVILPLVNPLKATGGLVILRGNLAPDGCVIKVAGMSVSITGGRRVSSSVKKTPWPRSRNVTSKKAMSWLFAMKVRKAGRACERC